MAAPPTQPSQTQPSQTMNAFTQLFLILVALSVAIQWWLDRRQAEFVAAHRERVPAPFAERIGLDAHRKAADYTLAKLDLGKLELALATALLLLWTVGGGLEALDRVWRGLELSPLITGVAVMISFSLIATLLELPLSAYRTFVLEARFGFNRTTPALFAADLFKSALLTLLIGVPLAWVALWLMGTAGRWWWLWLWLVWSGFSLSMMWAWPTLIAPLFNKFVPLEEGELKRRIEALLGRCGFRSDGLFVMDGSRRSSHGNAYFAGLGDHKRIVFYDTLLEGLEPAEVEAVLAHELGHFRLRHVVKRLLLMLGMSLAGLALLGWLAGQEWFYHGLGVDQPSDHTALLLFLLAAPPFTLLLQPLLAALSRRHEFEADAYAARQADAADLVRALLKLYRENASTLTPDPLYAAFHYSHPPAAERIGRLTGEDP